MTMRADQAFVRTKYRKAATTPPYIGFWVVYDHIKDDGKKAIALGEGWSAAEAWRDAAKRVRRKHDPYPHCKGTGKVPSIPPPE